MAQVFKGAFGIWCLEFALKRKISKITNNSTIFQSIVRNYMERNDQDLRPLTLEIEGIWNR